MSNRIIAKMDWRKAGEFLDRLDWEIVADSSDGHHKLYRYVLKPQFPGDVEETRFFIGRTDGQVAGPVVVSPSIADRGDAEALFDLTRLGYLR